MAKSLEGYWEGEDNDPSNAITEIVIKMEKAVNLPGDLYDVYITDFKYYVDDRTVIRKKGVQRRGKGNFQFTIRISEYGWYFVCGTVSKKGKKWVAVAEVERAEFSKLGHLLNKGCDKKWE
jgi:hypothetical protein